jgi:hypothetical protein
MARWGHGVLEIIAGVEKAALLLYADTAANAPSAVASHKGRCDGETARTN